MRDRRRTRQLTNAKKSSQSPAWSPDGSKLAFISDRTDKRQIYVINPQGGEAEALTSLEDGVSSFAWSPDGTTIAYTATEPKPAAIKDRDKKYGEFQVVEQDHRMTHLFAHRRRHARDAHADQRRLHRRQLRVVARRQEHRLRPPRQPRAQERRLRRHLDRHGRRRVDPQAGHAGRSRLESGLVARRIAHRVPDRDGEPGVLLHATALIATVPAAGGAPTVLSAAFDEDPQIVAWKPSGLFFAASARTYAYLYRLDPQTKAITKVPAPDQTVNSSFSLSKDGQTIASLRAGRRSRWRRCSSRPARAGLHRKKLTDMNAQTASWTTSDARGRVVEEPGRRDDRRRAAQAGRFRSRRRSIRCSS